MRDGIKKESVEGVRRMRVRDKQLNKDVTCSIIFRIWKPRAKEFGKPIDISSIKQLASRFEDIEVKEE